VAVGSFRRRDDAQGHRASDATAEAFELGHGGRALSIADQSKARAADLLKGLSDPEIVRALQPLCNGDPPKTAQRRLQAELQAGWQLLVRNLVNFF
jgi:hypothetical protein